MSSEESSYDKSKTKPLRSRSFHQQLIIIFSFLVFFGIALLIAPITLDGGDVKSYVRHSILHEEQSSSLNSEKMRNEPSIKYSDLATSLEDAKMEIEESEEEALAKTEEELKEILSKVESTLKKSLKQLLLNQKGLSSEKAKEVEDAVVEELESGVRERIESEALVIKEDAEDDLDTVVMNDMNADVNPEGIESDVAAMREYFSKEAQSEIEYAGKMITENIRGIVESIEKKVIKDKLGIQVTENELESSELQSKVSDVANDLLKNEEDEFKKMEKTVSVDVERTNNDIQKALKDFLETKGLSSAEVEQIQSEISDQFYDMVQESIQYGSQEVKEEVEEVAHFELSNLIDEDKEIIAKAKQLGLHIPYNENQSEIDVIEKDLNGVKHGLDEFLKDNISLLVKDLKTDLLKMVKKIERDILDEKGIAVTETELDNLVRKRIPLL